ncbi:TPA: streptococcal pyrogenic exotoxin SpeH, partial [Streptococcus equi subsp. equi]|nr:streptococcal pyrogenic exotoxin SpeH [Streptococcus equi subsp. equi]HEK9585700.1 streptococcal pyrogenic exotoxin SpeH [Streptococcus equi subsp. equi]HEK9608418.1 streptococcal pyrogenic exotoxin SpeH [Streptococcus equi subsp. equi]HEK9624661.1 streptococcal pyrogenic exotoxin SpeH [Streptococcus equi subsp. equi]HEK9714772.1 streptococcal pyrogenic exotoxin SpeH [Streptococcus equi subsp. equi]
MRYNCRYSHIDKKIYSMIICLSFLLYSNVVQANSYNTTNRHNLESLYKHDSNLIEADSIKNSPDIVTSHMLKYSVKDKNLSVFFEKDWISQEFKDKEVDIYALSAQEACECPGKRYEAFGGITLTNSEKKEIKVPINVWDKSKQHPPMFITVNKPKVTAQEVDIKVRKLLIKKYDIYNNREQKYSKGTVTLDLNSGKDIVFDLYYFGNGDFNSMLKIYSNNERIDSTQ